MVKVALAGNPNCGKTTLYNSLTGATAYVGNWPGVTVEKRSGTYYFKGKHKKEEGIEIVDLPGIYSLSPFTPEEIVSRNHILNEHPDVVVNVVDGTNLERNLYMTTQILEMDVPVVVAINMADAVEHSGLRIDTKALSEALGVPVVLVSALHRKGLENLMQITAETAQKPRKGVSFLEKDELIEKARKIYESREIGSALFHAVKALEGDELEAKENHDAFQEIQNLDKRGKDYSKAISTERYQFITPLCEKAIDESEAQAAFSRSDKVDRVLTHRVFGPIIFAAILFLIFHFTFSADLFYLGAMGVPFGEGYPGFIVMNIGGEEYRPFAGLFYSADGINSIGEFFHVLAGDNETGIVGCICLGFKQLLLNWNSPEWVISMFYDGILNGVAAVLGFVPQIMILYAFFSILEDSGYMARVAFMLDRLFRKLGVSGRAFIPMIMGFGCAVPAMINTRTLSSDKERTKTLRVIPFFTCGAKAEFLAIIAAAVAAAINFDAGVFTFLMYLLGIVVAIVAVVVMSKTTQREKVPPFIMELPSYHRPQIRALLIHIWDKGKHFIQKAFTIILVSTIIIWFLASFTPRWEFIGEGTSGSILEMIGCLIQPIFTPLGFGVQAGPSGWALSVATIQGLVAKENVTATIETLGGVLGVADFAGIVKLTGISTGAVVAFGVFNLLTIPCFASVATLKAETSSKKSFWLTIAFWFGTSYVLGILTFLTLEYVWTLSITLPLIAVGVVALILYDRHKTKQEQAAA
ncbi:MAG: ferrous iron transporter B [Bacilli bacterium]|nr:ferrous iron transporter B [Bacilli bacterium]